MGALHVGGDVLEDQDQRQTKRAADRRADQELGTLDQAKVEAAQTGCGGSRGDGTVSSSIACTLRGANRSGGSSSSICIIIHAGLCLQERLTTEASRCQKRLHCRRCMGTGCVEGLTFQLPGLQPIVIKRSINKVGKTVSAEDGRRRQQLGRGQGCWDVVEQLGLEK